MACAFPEEDLNEECDCCGNHRTCFCLKCVVSLCDKCKEKHVDHEENHDILELPPMEQDLPMCDVHDDITCTLYCWTCQESLCQYCVQEKHTGDGHHVLDIESAALIKRNQIIKEHAEGKHVLSPQIQNQVQNIQEGVEMYKAYIQSIKDAMIAQAERMKEMVNEIVEERQRELKEMERNSAMTLEDQRQKLEGHMAEINDTINEYRETEQTGDPEKIKEFADKNRDKIRRLKQLPELEEVKPPTYETPKVDIEFIRQMFGKLMLKQHTWSTSESLAIPNQEELIQLPELDKEEIRKRFGTLTVTNTEPTEAQEDSVNAENLNTNSDDNPIPTIHDLEEMAELESRTEEVTDDTVTDEGTLRNEDQNPSDQDNDE
ncbi:E3 ubiquitin-protein ligase TRIM71-like [Saccostrea cucullata]|uniref:E3 ubiquitin-protein ligase TRIM71-like n=1 Tax=Saccostrea cuccullata TaxID=36930 RepID=UPI002ED492DA